MTHPTAVTLIGASRGLGRTLAETFHRRGAQVLVTARGRQALDTIARDLPGIATLAHDAALPDAPTQAFAIQIPQVLILNGGAIPPCRPLPDMDWDAFSSNWNIDTQMSFHFLQAALILPLPPGTTVVTISSGAMLNGSPVSGGYAGAKKMQAFLTGYAQKESDRAGLGLRFLSLAPLRLMPQAAVGAAGLAGYAAYNGTTEAEFLVTMGPVLALQTVADALATLIDDPAAQGNYGVAPDGATAVV